jgi:hypothetical protein
MTTLTHQADTSDTTEQDGPGPFDIFVSHAGENRALAIRLRQALIDAGLRPWVSFVDIPVGAQYPERIVRAIDQSRAMVLMVSRASMQSEHVYREVIEASSSARNIPLLPIYVEPDVAIPPRLRYYLQSLHRMKFTSDNIELAAPVVAAALRDRDSWKRIATAPTLAERLSASPRRTWVGALGITFVAGLLVWGVQSAWGLYAQRQATLARDAAPEALALVQVRSAERPASDAVAPWQVRLDVMLASDRTRFADLKLVAHTRGPADVDEVRDLSAAIAPVQVGGGQMLTALMPKIGEQTAFCLSMPHPRTGQRWRLSTPYAAEYVREGDLDTVRFRQSGLAVAGLDDGGPCR